MTKLRQCTACVCLLLTAAAGGALVARPTPAVAQQGAVEEELPSLTTEEIIERLDTSRAPGPPADVRVRGLTPMTWPNEEGEEEGPATAARADGAGSGRVDIRVWFDYDSARLTPEAREELDSLGAALSSEQLEDYAFEVAGHTDAAGSDAYNLDLSRRRAASVVDYLNERFGIDRARLRSEGYGESRLYDPAKPRSGVNRRVEIVNLGQATAAR